MSLRVLNAHNRGPFTLDGTRTYLVGERQLAVVDPGPDRLPHVRALTREAARGRHVVILQTHDHADHAGAATRLADRLGAPVVGAGDGADPLDDGEAVETDHGRLVAVETPGHARRHLAFHWPERGAVFVGDLLLGEGSTTWVGAYPGCVADYLRSLERVEALEPGVLFPAHGPPIRQPMEALQRYADHRRERLSQLRSALARTPDASVPELTGRVYGDELSADLEEAARGTIEAMLHHLDVRPG